MEVLGVVMNQTSPPYGLAESLNAGALRRWAKAPFLGCLPFLFNTDKENIKRIIKEEINLDPVMTWLKR